MLSHAETAFAAHQSLVPRHIPQIPAYRSRVMRMVVNQRTNWTWKRTWGMTLANNTIGLDILLHCQDLAMGETRKSICPYCNGGETHERSFSTTREPGGVAYMCHRASCDFKGRTGSNGPVGEPAPSIPSPYMGSISSLAPAAVAKLSARYGIPDVFVAKYIRDAGSGWYALPLFDPLQYPRGWVLRWPWGHILPPGGTKTKLFLDKPENVSMAWYGNGHRKNVILVEDQLSALRIYARYDVCAVALLGTNLSAAKVAELQRYTKYIVLMLDNDATEKAFELAHTWAPAFKSFHVQVLTGCDIKDMMEDDLDELIELIA